MIAPGLLACPLLACLSAACLPKPASQAPATALESSCAASQPAHPSSHPANQPTSQPRPSPKSLCALYLCAFCAPCPQEDDPLWATDSLVHGLFTAEQGQQGGSGESSSPSAGACAGTAHGETAAADSTPVGCSGRGPSRSAAPGAACSFEPFEPTLSLAGPLGRSLWGRPPAQGGADSSDAAAEAEGLADAAHAWECTQPAGVLPWRVGGQARAGWVEGPGGAKVGSAGQCRAGQCRAVQ